MYKHLVLYKAEIKEYMRPRYGMHLDGPREAAHMASNLGGLVTWCVHALPTRVREGGDFPNFPIYPYSNLDQRRWNTGSPHALTPENARK